jgi:pimeloyl-ACP methyl ester carboxylesterase
MTMMERYVEVDGVQLFAEGYALQELVTAVLLTGAAMQATTWEERFRDELTARGIAVIVFDWRDIGRSTWRSFKENPYSIDTLAQDVISVARAFDRPQVHLVGFSMGGCVAQLVALRTPESVRSLSLLSSGFASEIHADRGERGRALFELFRLPRPLDDAEEVSRLVDQWRLLCGRDFILEERTWKGRARSWVQRGQNPSCPHLRLGPQVFGVDRSSELATIAVPTRVLHGTDDPMFPVAHGEAIARCIPGPRSKCSKAGATTSTWTPLSRAESRTTFFNRLPSSPCVRSHASSSRQKSVNASMSSGDSQTSTIFPSTSLNWITIWRSSDWPAGAAVLWVTTAA